MRYRVEPFLVMRPIAAPPTRPVRGPQGQTDASLNPHFLLDCRNRLEICKYMIGYNILSFTAVVFTEIRQNMRQYRNDLNSTT